MAKPVIAVIGGTGSQGGGVVDALLACKDVDRNKFVYDVAV